MAHSQPPIEPHLSEITKLHYVCILGDHPNVHLTTPLVKHLHPLIPLAIPIETIKLASPPFNAFSNPY